ncbi:MAG: hypothetical protein WCD79_14120 [Chthoniobacteraceae bacterium]
MTALVACICAPPVVLASHPKVPTTWDVISDIHKELDDLSRNYKHFFKANSDAILQGVATVNNARRAVIAPLYQQAFNTAIPGSTNAVPEDELANLTDGSLYADAWRKLIADAPVESSIYMTKKIAPILTDPTTDRAAVIRIQNDARDEWEKYKSIAANGFSHDAAQITTDFDTRLAVLAQEHRDLRQALAAITGPIPAADFDANFQKYVTVAESKLQPAVPPPTAPVVSQPAPPSTASPAPSATPAPEPVKLTLDELASRLAAQKQTLDAIKLQAQTLDDNYPALHRELGTQIERLSSEIFLLRLLLIGVGAGTLLGIVMSVAALDRARVSNSKKNLQGGARKHDPEAQLEDPLKLILARIYNLETELSRLNEQLITGEKSSAGDDILTENAAQENISPQ